jgi:hypothetical protein
MLTFRVKLIELKMAFHKVFLCAFSGYLPAKMSRWKAAFSAAYSGCQLSPIGSSADLFALERFFCLSFDAASICLACEIAIFYYRRCLAN